MQQQHYEADMSHLQLEQPWALLAQFITASLESSEIIGRSL